MGPYTLHGLYLAPSLSPSTAKERYENLSVDDCTLFLGDFNIRLAGRTGDNCGTSDRRRDFEAWLDKHGLTIWNAELAYGVRTFTSGRGSSIIDYFISTAEQFIAPELTIRDDVDVLQSDHHLCELSFLPAASIPALPPTDSVRRQWRLQRLADPK
ncbi:hypothetical protein DFQ29_003612, partial [Apophysomyces sp. BC1021]